MPQKTFFLELVLFRSADCKMCGVWFLLVCCTLKLSFAAQCNELDESTTCNPVKGCFWDSDHCACAANISMDVPFLLDASGSIGAANFQVELNWVVEILESGLPKDTRVAFIRFDQISSVFLDFGQSADMSVEERQTVVKDIEYTGYKTWTDLSVKDAIGMYNTESSNEISKVMILITDGKPSPGHGVCEFAPTLKAMDVTTIIIAVGNWDSTQVDCLIEDESHIIKVDNYSDSQIDKILPALTDVTCPIDYNFKLTEVQLDTGSSGNGSRFVEIYNEAIAVNLDDIVLAGIFVGRISNDSLTLGQSQYLVLYDNAKDTPVCKFCNCEKTDDLCDDAIYVECCDSEDCACAFGGSEMSNENWFMKFVSFEDNYEVDAVEYDSDTWPIIDKGYSYELEYNGYDNDLGDNWQQSCYKRGTPGFAPIRNCSHFCTDEKCKQNGADNAFCDGGQNGECDCSKDSGYYYSDKTCKIIPMPGNCDAHWLKNKTVAQKYTKFEWQSAATNSAVNYSLTYYVKGGGTDKTKTSQRSKIVIDYDYSRGYDSVAGYVRTLIGDGKSEAVECWPTTQPPTDAPTTTPEPTNEAPKMWVSGDLCAEERCECNGEDWDCVGEDIYKDYAASDAPQFVTVKKYPGDSPLFVDLRWKIELITDEYDDDDDNDDNEDDNEEEDSVWSRVGLKKSKSVKFLKGSNRKLQIFETTTATTMDPEDFGIIPREGWVLFNGSVTESVRIQFEIVKKEVKKDSRVYRLYRLSLLECEVHSGEECHKAYPSSFYMVVDITGGTGKDSSSKSHRKKRRWIWWLIAALVAAMLILAFLLYKYWWKERQANKDLAETTGMLDAEIEDNELGFAHDLGAGDITFNPLATGVGAMAPVPMLGDQYIEARKKSAAAAMSDIPTETFRIRAEMGPGPAAKAKSKNDLTQPLLG